MSKIESDMALAAVLARYIPKNHSPLFIANLALLVSRDADGLHRLAEHECSRGLIDREKSRVALLETRISASLHPYGVTATFGGDPRGSVVKLKFPNGETFGDFGGEGLWCL